MHHRSTQVSLRAAFTWLSLSMIGLAVYIWRYECYRHNAIFVCSVTLLMSSVAALATRRILLANLVTTAMVALIRAIALEKHRRMNMTLHAYDVVFYLSSPPIISFLWSHFRIQFLALLFASIASIAAASKIFHLDPTRIRRLYSLFAIAVLGTVAYISAPQSIEGHYWEHFLSDRSLTSFYSSWRDTVQVLWQAQIFDSAKTSRHEPFHASPVCDMQGDAPNIVLIHQESMLPPSMFLNESLYNTSLDGLFRSHDEKVHKLRVETYGGASWLTEFSVMTGLSTYSFGSMRAFVQAMMAGNVKMALTDRLRQCGYHTSVFYPAHRTFGSSEAFYKSIGVQEFFDIHDQKAPTIQERDRFYYENAMSHMSRHFLKTQQPLFTFVITMAGHQPYKSAYMPEFVTDSGSRDLDPETREWLRRVAMVDEDYAYLKAELSARFPGKPFLFVHYGDHQPTVTRPHVTFNKQTSETPAQQTAYSTYFAIEGLNYKPPPMPEFETLDVSYLGLTLLKSAGIPLMDVDQECERLMSLCCGRYYDCVFRSEILDFHRRLIDSRLMTIPKLFS
jgi:phosphoglycerol transferase MdoB-like AlkP superfamily enzyme